LNCTSGKKTYSQNCFIWITYFWSPLNSSLIFEKTLKCFVNNCKKTKISFRIRPGRITKIFYQLFCLNFRFGEQVTIWLYKFLVFCVKSSQISTVLKIFKYSFKKSIYNWCESFVLGTDLFTLHQRLCSLLSKSWRHDYEVWS